MNGEGVLMWNNLKPNYIQCAVTGNRYQLMQYFFFKCYKDVSQVNAQYCFCCCYIVCCNLRKALRAQQF